MPREFPPILLISGDAAPPAWLVDGAPAGAAIRCTRTVEDALALVQRGRAAVVLCEPQDADGSSTEPLIDYVNRHPSLIAAIGIASRMQVDASEILRLARSGVHALLFAEDRKSPLAVRRALNEALTRCRSQHVWGVIAPLTPDRIRPLVAYGLHHAHQPMSVDGVARALGLHRKTLAERCALAGTLPPQQLLGWCRLLAAAVLMEDRRRRIDHIAMELDFPSGAAFRNLLKRYTGFSPAELRAKGAIAEMSRQFREAMATGGWDEDAVIRAS